MHVIRDLVDDYAAKRILLAKETVALYEDIQEFWVAETISSPRVIGCGALHVMWEDLAEIRTLALNRNGEVAALDTLCLLDCLQWRLN